MNSREFDRMSSIAIELGKINSRSFFRIEEVGFTADMFQRNIPLDEKVADLQSFTAESGYKGLQTVAKAFGIPANLRSEDLQAKVNSTLTILSNLPRQALDGRADAINAAHVVHAMKAERGRRFRGDVASRPPARKGWRWAPNGRNAWKEVPHKG